MPSRSEAEWEDLIKRTLQHARHGLRRTALLIRQTEI
jgi:hypothetical protein